MAWTYLLCAGVCEIVGTTAFRYTGGFTRLWPSIGCIGVWLLSFYLLSRSMTLGIPLGTAYAVWTGIGAAGTALIGIGYYAEPTSPMRLICLALLIGAIVGLKIFEQA